MANDIYSPSTIGRDLVLTDSDLSRICSMMYERSGIVLDQSKREMVYSRLAKRMRLHGLTLFKDYVDRLEKQPKAREWEAFTNALTTNLTAFYREAHHFDILAEHLKKLNRPVRIWCAAASTGEEPYSIAMTLIEALGQEIANRSEIIATDIDTEALSKASSGVYPINQALLLGENKLRQFFLKGSGDKEGFARIRNELFTMVQFSPLNLHDSHWSVRGSFDVIFCRNIMIYFNKESQIKILSRFVPMLASDGLFITGHSENFTYLFQDLKLIGKTVYSHAPR